MKSKVLLISSTSELMYLMSMALADDSRFEVVGKVTDHSKILDAARGLRPDAVVFHEGERTANTWPHIAAQLQEHLKDVAVVELAAEIRLRDSPGTAPVREQVAVAELALSVGNTIALVIDSKRL